MRQIFIFFFVSSLPSSLTGVTEIGTAHVKMLSSMTASVEVIEQLFLILSTVGPRLYNSAFNSAHPLSLNNMINESRNFFEKMSIQFNSNSNVISGSSPPICTFLLFFFLLIFTERRRKKCPSVVSSPPPTLDLSRQLVIVNSSSDLAHISFSSFS